MFNCKGSKSNDFPDFGKSYDMNKDKTKNIHTHPYTYLDFYWDTSVHCFFLYVRTHKFKFRLTVLNFFENLRLDCS